MRRLSKSEKGFLCNKKSQDLLKMVLVAKIGNIKITNVRSTDERVLKIFKV